MGRWRRVLVGLLRAQEDSVTVIFPMRFKDPSDATMACTFLAEFVEARRQASLTTAPSCSYSKPPPLELRGGPPTALGANGGYGPSRAIHAPARPPAPWPLAGGL